MTFNGSCKLFHFSNRISILEHNQVFYLIKLIYITHSIHLLLVIFIKPKAINTNTLSLCTNTNSS